MEIIQANKDSASRTSPRNKLMPAESAIITRITISTQFMMYPIHEDAALHSDETSFSLPGTPDLPGAIDKEAFYQSQTLHGYKY